MTTQLFDNDAERSVLGGILISCDAIPPVIDSLQQSDFHAPKHRVIFAAMKLLAEKQDPIDELTVAEELRTIAPNAKTPLTDLAELTQCVPTAANIDHYAGIVRSYAARRELIGVLETGLADARKPDRKNEDVAASLLSRVSDVAGRGASEGEALRSLIRTEYQSISERKGRDPGISCGFSEIDQLVGGLSPGDLVIVAGRPSMGKTALVLNMIQRMTIRKNLSAALFSLEMQKEQVAQRMMSCESRVDAMNLRRGELRTTQWEHLAEGCDRLSFADVWIWDQGIVTIEQLRAAARVRAARNKPDMIAVDYLQLMGGSSGKREGDVSEISRGLKNLAKELQIPIVALSQLNRSLEQRQDKRPMLSDLRESGAIEQDADSVLFVYRDDYYNQNSEHPGTAEIGIAKNRNGPTGMVRLRWIQQFTRFEQIGETHG